MLELAHVGLPRQNGLVVDAAKFVSRPDTERPHEIVNVTAAGPSGLWALPAGPPNVLLGGSGERVERCRRRRLRVRFNQRCGAGIRRDPMCHALRDNQPRVLCGVPASKAPCTRQPFGAFRIKPIELCRVPGEAMAMGI